MADHSIQVLLCGDFETAEMRPIADSIECDIPEGQIRRFDSLPKVIETGWSPDLIVVAQQRPDQFIPSDVRRLQEFAPLARWICCLGLWCESDGRNGSPWPDACRVFARSAEARLQNELSILRGERHPLPLTAARDEIFAFDCPGRWPAGEISAPVQVIGADRALRQTIEDLLESAGYFISSVVAELPPQVVVWDVDPWCEEIAGEIRDFQLANPAVPIVALMNFGHPQAVEEARIAGVHSVVAKLTVATDLFAEIEAIS